MGANVNDPVNDAIAGEVADHQLASQAHFVSSLAYKVHRVVLEPKRDKQEQEEGARHEACIVERHPAVTLLATQRVHLHELDEHDDNCPHIVCNLAQHHICRWEERILHRGHINQ